MQENEFRPLPYSDTKINSKCTTDLNIRAKMIKILEENTGVNLHGLELGNDFLGLIPKIEVRRED